MICYVLLFYQIATKMTFYGLNHQNESLFSKNTQLKNNGLLSKL